MSGAFFCGGHHPPPLFASAHRSACDFEHKSLWSRYGECRDRYVDLRSASSRGVRCFGKHDLHVAVSPSGNCDCNCFTFLKDKTTATAGNLSVQIQKLKDAGYIDVTKQFKDNYPQTICKITSKGVNAFEQYVKALNEYLHK